MKNAFSDESARKIFEEFEFRGWTFYRREREEDGVRFYPDKIHHLSMGSYAIFPDTKQGLKEDFRIFNRLGDSEDPSIVLSGKRIRVYILTLDKDHVKIRGSGAPVKLSYEKFCRHLNTLNVYVEETTDRH